MMWGIDCDVCGKRHDGECRRGSGLVGELSGDGYDLAVSRVERALDNIRGQRDRPPLRRVCTVKPSAKNETNCRSCRLDKSESGRPSSNLGQIVRRKSASPNVSELRACKRSEKLTGAL